MSWVETSQGKDGGYCKCDVNSTMIGSHDSSSFLASQMIYGRQCCPTGTSGWAFHAQADKNGPTGYQGGVAVGSNFLGKCFCPTGTGPKSNSAYSGESVNETCACPTGQNWYGANGCRKCPPGSSWNEDCGQCLCDATDQYYATYGVYNQTNSCTQKQFNAVGAYYSTSTCSAGCTMEAHYYDAGKNCCYCAAQVGAGHDAQHDSRGCLISD